MVHIVGKCYNYVNQATDGQPLTDIYDCTDGTPISGVARPTVGMFWAKVLLEKLKVGPITGIGDIGFNNNKTVRTDHIYNLNGQYVGNDAAALAPGIYIKGGRKVVVK